MGKMVNVLCLSPQFAKNQKSNDLQKSSFSPAATNDWQDTSQWVQTVKLFRGPQPGPPAGRPSGGGVGRGWGGAVPHLCAAALFPSLSAFLAQIQPIIRKILQGERVLPAQMTSCGLG